MNETILFAHLRKSPFKGRMTPAQVAGVKRLLAACERHRVDDLRHRANVLAQPFVETGEKMQPVREAFADSDKQAIARLNKAWREGKLPSVKAPYWRAGWFGRGDIQITHEDNYIKAGDLIGVDLVGNPSLALDPVISADIAVLGMKTGLFTGKKLSDYFNATKDDPVGARRIVNGQDRAREIAGYHRAFLAALVAASAAGDAPQPAPRPAPAPAREPEPEPEPEAITDAKTVSLIQGWLRNIGYTEVGAADGKLGPFTRGAIRAFRAENDLPPGEHIDPELMAALAKAGPRKIAHERAEATPAEIREKVPEVKATWHAKITGWITWAIGAIGAAFSGAVNHLEDAKGYLEPVRDIFYDVPGWLWFVALGGIGWYLSRRFREGEEAGVQAFKEGARR